MIVAFLYIFAVLEVGYGIGAFLRSQDAIIAPLAIGFAILTGSACRNTYGGRTEPRTASETCPDVIIPPRNRPPALWLRTLLSD